MSVLHAYDRPSEPPRQAPVRCRRRRCSASCLALPLLPVIVVIVKRAAAAALIAGSARQARPHVHDAHVPLDARRTLRRPVRSGPRRRQTTSSRPDRSCACCGSTSSAAVERAARRDVDRRPAPERPESWSTSQAGCRLEPAHLLQPASRLGADPLELSADAMATWRSSRTTSGTCATERAARRAHLRADAARMATSAGPLAGTTKAPVGAWSERIGRVRTMRVGESAAASRRRRLRAGRDQQEAAGDDEAEIEPVNGSARSGRPSARSAPQAPSCARLGLADRLLNGRAPWCWYVVLVELFRPGDDANAQARQRRRSAIVPRPFCVSSLDSERDRQAFRAMGVLGVRRAHIARRRYRSGPGTFVRRLPFRCRSI